MPAVSIHKAIYQGRIVQVRFLVEMGANVNAKDRFGRCPLMVATLLDHGEYAIRMAKLLLEHGADVNSCDGSGKTPLMYAATKGRVQLVDMLAKQEKTNLSKVDADGNTALMYAAASGYPAVTRVLVATYVRYGISCDIRNAMGYSALLIAIKRGHFVSALHLLQIGKASIHLRDFEYSLNAREWVENFSYTPPVVRSRSQLNMKSEKSWEFLTCDDSLYTTCQRHQALRSRLDFANEAFLPTILQSRSAVAQQRSPDGYSPERVLDSADARALLLDEIEKRIINAETDISISSRPVTTVDTPSSFPHTAQLRRLNPMPTRWSKEQIHSIFDMYSQDIAYKSVRKSSPNKSELRVPHPPHSHHHRDVPPRSKSFYISPLIEVTEQ